MGSRAPEAPVRSSASPIDRRITFFYVASTRAPGGRGSKDAQSEISVSFQSIANSEPWWSPHEHDGKRLGIVARHMSRRNRVQQGKSDLADTLMDQPEAPGERGPRFHGGGVPPQGDPPAQTDEIHGYRGCWFCLVSAPAQLIGEKPAKLKMAKAVPGAYSLVQVWEASGSKGTRKRPADSAPNYSHHRQQLRAPPAPRPCTSDHDLAWGRRPPPFEPWAEGYGGPSAAGPEEAAVAAGGGGSRIMPPPGTWRSGPRDGAPGGGGPGYARHGSRAYSTVSTEDDFISDGDENLIGRGVVGVGIGGVGEGGWGGHLYHPPPMGLGHPLGGHPPLANALAGGAHWPSVLGGHGAAVVSRRAAERATRPEGGWPPPLLRQRQELDRMLSTAGFPSDAAHRPPLHLGSGPQSFPASAPPGAPQRSGGGGGSSNGGGGGGGGDGGDDGSRSNGGGGGGDGGDGVNEGGGNRGGSSSSSSSSSSTHLPRHHQPAPQPDHPMLPSQQRSRTYMFAPNEAGSSGFPTSSPPPPPSFLEEAGWPAMRARVDSDRGSGRGLGALGMEQMADLRRQVETLTRVAASLQDQISAERRARSRQAEYLALSGSLPALRHPHPRAPNQAAAMVMAARLGLGGGFGFGSAPYSGLEPPGTAAPPLLHDLGVPESGYEAATYPPLDQGVGSSPAPGPPRAVQPAPLGAAGPQQTALSSPEPSSQEPGPARSDEHAGSPGGSPVTTKAAEAMNSSEERREEEGISPAQSAPEAPSPTEVTGPRVEAAGSMASIDPPAGQAEETQSSC